MMPAENLAAGLIDQIGGRVVAPLESALPEAAAWAVEVLDDVERRHEIGEAARELAEREFALAECTDRFETLLSGCAR
jgi:glycosyltransferase involved in cell wall biosynthesis